MKRWRNKEGLSLSALQERLAAKGIIVTKSTLSRYETGVIKHKNVDLCRAIESLSKGEVPAEVLLGLRTR